MIWGKKAKRKDESIVDQRVQYCKMSGADSWTTVAAVRLCLFHQQVYARGYQSGGIMYLEGLEAFRFLLAT